MTKKDYIEFIEKNLWDFWYTLKKYGTKESFKEVAQNIHQVLNAEYHHKDIQVIVKMMIILKNYKLEDSQVGKG